MLFEGLGRYDRTSQGSDALVSSLAAASRSSSCQFERNSFAPSLPLLYVLSTSFKDHNSLAFLGDGTSTSDLHVWILVNANVRARNLKIKETFH